MTSATSSHPGKIVLAVETSTSLGSLALISGQNTLKQLTWQREGSHSELVTKSFDELMKSLNLHLQSIAYIAVGVGPGSFTGIRVGVNFARALGFSLSRPVFAMNSLHLLVHQKSLETYRRPVFALQYGFRDIFYVGEYCLAQGITTNFIEVQKPRAVVARDVIKFIPAGARVVGGGLHALETLPGGPYLGSWSTDLRDTTAPEACFFSKTLVGISENPPLTDWIHTVPLYIRASEAEEKLRSCAD